jgi:[ribosomal protein S18]-alanine N-acetyltransferase
LELTFEPMCPEDLPEVLEIERRSFPQPWTPGLFLHELKVPFSRTTLIRASNGTRTTLAYVCRWLVGDEAHILNLAVHPDHRGRGLGRRLVELVVQEAQAAGARLVTLEVRRENAPARSLYRKLGFVDTGQRRNYYGRGEDAIIMSLALRPDESTSPED